MKKVTKNLNGSLFKAKFKLSKDHPLVKLFDGMKELGLFREYEDYYDWKARHEQVESERLARKKDNRDLV